LYDSFGGWHFVNVPKEISQEIKEVFGSVKKRGWGSIPVRATVGNSTWNTSIFPSREGAYLLALKKEIRQNETIAENDIISVVLEIQEII
jgi:hypothetical protein